MFVQVNRQTVIRRYQITVGNIRGLCKSHGWGLNSCYGPNSTQVCSRVYNSSHGLFTISRGFPGYRGCLPSDAQITHHMIIPNLTPRPLTPEASDYHFSDTSDRRGIQGSSETNWFLTDALMDHEINGNMENHRPSRPVPRPMEHRPRFKAMELDC